MRYALINNQRREACTTGPMPVAETAALGGRTKLLGIASGRVCFPKSAASCRARCMTVKSTARTSKASTGIVIEVQHSNITDAERLSRESFHGNLVWVMDGSIFRQNFDIYHSLPDLASELARASI